LSTKKKTRWTNGDLLREFKRLNAKYFGSHLEVLNIAFAPIDGLGHTFRYRTVGKRRSQADQFGIHVSREIQFSRRLWVGTLLHEMVHLEQRNRCSCNGQRFNERMRELAAAGAFNKIW
jgi:hypothetical protein